MREKVCMPSASRDQATQVQRRDVISEASVLEHGLTSGRIRQIITGMLCLPGASSCASIVGWLHQLHLFAGWIFRQGNLQAAEVQAWGNDFHAWHVPSQAPPVLEHCLQLGVIAAELTYRLALMTQLKEVLDKNVRYTVEVHYRVSLLI